jgi:hypothetical protein
MPRRASTTSRHAPLPRDATSKLIDTAIRGKRLLAFVYKGHARLVQPQIYGESSEHRMLSSYQIAGTSSRGEPGWLNSRLDLMQGLKLLDEHFARPRPDYNPLDKSFTKVYSQL